MTGAVMVCVAVLGLTSGVCLLAREIDRWWHNRADTVDGRYEQARALQCEHLRERAGYDPAAYERVHASLLRELQADDPALERQFRAIVRANGWRWSR